MEEKVHLDFSSPARKKKRRSSFFSSRLLGQGSSVLFENSPLGSLENEEVNVPLLSLINVKNKKVDEYLQKLRREKQQWIEYEKSLRSKYSKIIKPEESEEQDLNKYLDYLPQEDRDFLETLDKKVCELNSCKIELPTINERIYLMQNEFEKQVKTSKLIDNNYKMLMNKMDDLIFENLFDNEFCDSDESETEDSTVVRDVEDVLYIDGI